jgi:magnesium transporter
LIGSALPFLARRFGVDPATLSGPAITSIMDLLGVLVYFGYARLLLGHLLE